ncbi:MAG TPA: hypothetical protein VGC79_24880, partial [Polyangiaceae bacterium]
PPPVVPPPLAGAPLAPLPAFAIPALPPDAGVESPADPAAPGCGASLPLLEQASGTVNKASP